MIKHPSNRAERRRLESIARSQVKSDERKANKHGASVSHEGTASTQYVLDEGDQSGVREGHSDHTSADDVR